MEVGDEVEDPSVAHGADKEADRRSDGSPDRYGIKGDEEAGVRERKLGTF